MKLARTHRLLLTVEQGAQGGFGAIALQELARQGVFDTGLAVRNICLPDRFIDQASPDDMYADAEMTAADIVRTAKVALGLTAEIVPLSVVQ